MKYLISQLRRRRDKYISSIANHFPPLQPEICSLIHIVELDLSKNKIQTLPEDFGSLQRLQRLDLYQNQLVHIPISFCHLKSLKWLDLKNNPLDEHIKSAAGECLNDKQCKNCARNVCLSTLSLVTKNIYCIYDMDINSNYLVTLYQYYV